MLLLAKRVSASAMCVEDGFDFGNTERSGGLLHDRKKLAAALFGQESSIRMSTRIGGPNLYVAKARRAGAVPGTHHLFGLAFAAVGNAPKRPMIAVGDGRAAIPEFGGDAAIGGILEHAHAFPPRISQPISQPN